MLFNKSKIIIISGVGISVDVDSKLISKAISFSILI